MWALRLNSFRMNCYFSRSLISSNVNRECVFSFCTLIESPKADDPIEVTESPELPIWIRLSKNDTSEDDFVIPSISYWVENHKPKGYDKNTVSLEAESDTDVKKITKILTKLFESPESVVQALNDSNVAPSESLVAHMLKRFDNNWKSAYGVFIWAESHMGFKFSRETYDLLVDCLGKSRNFDLVWRIVDEMVQMGDGYVTINTMAKVIRRLTKAGRHEDAIDTFRGIERFGVKKDLAALNVLVDALVKEKNVERANNMYLELKNEIPPNSHTFNALIHGWSKARKLEKAESAMEEMKGHGICPDVVSYTSLIESHCSEKDFRKVHRILDEMQEKGCPPNVVTYTIVMHALGKSKELDEALKVYEKAKASGCAFDASFYSSLIYILSKAGRLRDARQVFDEMPRQGIERDTQTYNTMIASACDNTREEDALKLLHEMETGGVTPDFETYAPLLKMCCKLKRMKVVSFLLAHMSDNDVSVGMGAYSLLVRGLCKSGKLKHACVFLEDAVVRGFVPYDTMFKLLETELAKAGMSEEKNRIRELMLKSKKSR